MERDFIRLLQKKRKKKNTYWQMKNTDNMCLYKCVQVESEFILESERESFIEQVREVIENADEKGLERDTSSQVKAVTLYLFLFFLS